MTNQLFYPDESRIGQAACARIRLEIANRDMAENAKGAFTETYVNEDCRAMHARLYEDARRQRDRALAVLDAVGHPA